MKDGLDDRFYRISESAISIREVSSVDIDEKIFTEIFVEIETKIEGRNEEEEKEPDNEDRNGMQKFEESRKAE